jgi:imidazolonepropionase-like amidohydrolase
MHVLERTVLRLFLAGTVAMASAAAQNNQPVNPLVVKAARMVDVKSGKIVTNPVIVIEGERITSVSSGGAIPAGSLVLELGSVTLLPGLIDCHTHMMARMNDDPDSYVVTLATKSQAFRALQGAANAKATLLAGFTTVRDVESEGSGYSDVALRDAISEGLVEGPRMQVATRGIASVGQYFPFGVSPDLHDFPTGAQMVSGVEDARRAAREQIGGGANLLKVYADWVHPTLTVEELRVIVEEAHKAGIKVAAHADHVEGIRNALTAGVDSIEHGSLADDSSLQLIKEKGAYLVPTKAVFQKMLDTAPGRGKAYPGRVIENAKHILPKAEAMGVKIANGSDPATAEEHGKNGHELVVIHALGLSAPTTLQAATINAADLMGWQDRVGALEKGLFADIVAVCGNPLEDMTEVERVRFVMKGGTVVKNETALCK